MKQQKNHVNSKNIFINKRFPKFEAQIKAESTKKGFVKSTKNCSFAVLDKKSDYSTSHVTVNDIQVLETIDLQTVKKIFAGNKRKFARDDDIESDSPTAVTSLQMRKK